MTQDRQQKKPEGGMDPIKRVGGEEQTSASSYTRLAATVILVVAVPLLLLSSSALAFFYIAPTRFESFLARLPGEAAIRTVLIFAPKAPKKNVPFCRPTSSPKINGTNSA